jgi:hypothetical protein
MSIVCNSELGHVVMLMPHADSTIIRLLPVFKQDDVVIVIVSFAHSTCRRDTMTGALGLD